MARKKVERPPDPDRLVRAAAGRYRTEDSRFEVSQEAAGTWYITDAERTDELGLARVTGPYETLAAVRTAIPELRSAPAPVIPLEARRATRAPAKEPGAEQTGRSPRASNARREKPQPPPPAPPPPTTWLDKLGPDEASRARRLIRAAERAGLPDAERVVRRDVEGLGPRIAPTVLLRRAWREAIAGWDGDEVAAAARSARASLPDEAGAAEDAAADMGDKTVSAVARVVARETARRVLEAVASGEGGASGLPRWNLEEIDERGERTGRRVGISVDDLDAAARN